MYRNRAASFRPTRWQLGIALLGILLIGGALITHQLVQAGGVSPHEAPNPVLTGGKIAAHPVPVGMSAIHPRADLVQTAGPSFTAADAQQYAAAYAQPFAVSGSSAPVVASVQFLNAAQVSAQLQGESMGVPNNTLLCLVHISGTFASTGAPGSKTVIFHDGVMVFDAHTGNLLVSNL